MEDVIRTDEQLFDSLAQKVLNRLDWCVASDDRKKAENRWVDAQNFWLGHQWDGIKSRGIKGRSAEDKKLHPNPVDNYVKAHVEGLVGDITDRPVDIQVKHREDGDEQVAKKISDVVKYLWYRNKGDRKLEFVVKRGVMYGPLIAKVYWDNTWYGTPSNPYVGDVKFITILPTNFFVDPRIKGVEEQVLQHAEFMMYGVRRSMSYIREAYPEKGHLVMPDTYSAYVTTLTGEDEEGPETTDAEVLLIEYWYKGKPVAPEFPATDTPPIVMDGWVHKAVVAGGVLLEHRTYVYPFYPFVLEWIYQSDESIYGYGDVHDMLLPQLILNKLNEISVEGAALLSQGNWITEEGNIRNKAQFQKYATMGGAILPVVDVGRTRRESGGNVPSSLFNHYRQELMAMETASGRYDVAQGRTPRNVQAASAIALLLQQAGGRVRQRARAVASFVEQVVSMMVALVGLYYTEERLIRTVGSDGSQTWQNVSRTDFLKTKTWIDPLSGEQFVEEYIPEVDIIVSAGTDTPVSKAYYSEMAMQLYSAGVIDEVALLGTIQFPGWRDILARKHGLAMQQMQAEQMQTTQMPPVATTSPAQMMPQTAPPTEMSAISPELQAVLGAEAMQQQAQQPLPTEATPQDVAQLMALLQSLQG